MIEIRRQATYRDLMSITVRESEDKLVVLDPPILYEYQKGNNDMGQILRGKMFVRKTVFNKLLLAYTYLQKRFPSLGLLVTYGYRSLEIQKRRFQQQISMEVQKYFYPNPITLYEKIHQVVAVPFVAGHPTGGAVDVTLWDIKKRKFLDLGSNLYDYSSLLCEVWAKGISSESRQGRMLLRDCMMKAGFAPFDGEYWHFSYGDREWAYYYNKSHAIYEQIPLTNLFSMISS